MKTWSFILLFIVFMSCNRVPPDEKIRRELPGDWTTLDQYMEERGFFEGKMEPPPSFFNSSQGKEGTLWLGISKHFTFYPNGVVYPNRGFFRWGRLPHSKIFFYGISTRWQINHSRLCIYDPADSVWRSGKITRFTGDTLDVLFDEDHPQTLVRVDHTPDSALRFDRILFSSTGCYGNCPEMYCSVDQNGNFQYWGGHYAQPQGGYTAKIPGHLFFWLANNFKKAKVGGLSNDYSANHTDDRSLFVSFVDNDTIVKTIHDYGAASPAPFLRACLPMEHLHHYLPLKSTPFPIIYHDYAQILPNNTQLSPHECFLLWIYLMEGKQTLTHFTPRYTIIPKPLWLNSMKVQKNWDKLRTDGRYYELHRKGKTSVTIDIGFNFFDKNLQLLQGHMP